jgi:hypothetical protein
MKNKDVKKKKKGETVISYTGMSVSWLVGGNPSPPWIVGKQVSNNSEKRVFGNKDTNNLY